MKLLIVVFFSWFFILPAFADILICDENYPAENCQTEAGCSQAGYHWDEVPEAIELWFDIATLSNQQKESLFYTSKCIESAATKIYVMFRTFPSV